MTPAQCRAGRSLLGWSQKVLAPHSTVASFETRARQSGMVGEWRAKMEAAGVEFIPGGVRMKESEQ